MPLMFSCTSNEKQKTEYIKNWLEKELILEDSYRTYNVYFQKYDTLSVTRNTKKIVSYYNSFTCSTCIDELQLWSPIINEYKNDSTIEFLFILKTDEHIFNHHIKPYLRIWGSNLRISFEENSNFQTNNSLSEDHFFNTFLVGEDNKVILIGNPHFNKDLMELYKKKISL